LDHGEQHLIPIEEERTVIEESGPDNRSEKIMEPNLNGKVLSPIDQPKYKQFEINEEYNKVRNDGQGRRIRPKPDTKDVTAISREQTDKKENTREKNQNEID
jgi:hypothetical protein